MSHRKHLTRGVPVIVGIALCYYFPLFHINPIGQSTGKGEANNSNQTDSEALDPLSYVEEIWASRLRLAEGSLEIKQVLSEFENNFTQAKQDFGRQVGLGGASCFLVRGRGTVETISRRCCMVKVGDDFNSICLDVGVIVGNTVREALGVNASEFASSQDFNFVSSQLNMRVEHEVIQPSKQRLKPGVEIAFVGCGEVDAQTDLDPLRLVPIHLTGSAPKVAE